MNRDLSANWPHSAHVPVTLERLENVPATQRGRVQRVLAARHTHTDRRERIAQNKNRYQQRSAHATTKPNGVFVVRETKRGRHTTHAVTHRHKRYGCAQRSATPRTTTTRSEDQLENANRERDVDSVFCVPTKRKEQLFEPSLQHLQCALTEPCGGKIYLFSVCADLFCPYFCIGLRDRAQRSPFSPFDAIRAKQKNLQFSCEKLTFCKRKK